MSETNKTNKQHAIMLRFSPAAVVESFRFNSPGKELKIIHNEIIAFCHGPNDQRNAHSHFTGDRVFLLVSSLNRFVLFRFFFIRCSLKINVFIDVKRDRPKWRRKRIHEKHQIGAIIKLLNLNEVEAKETNQNWINRFGVGLLRSSRSILMCFIVHRQAIVLLHLIFWCVFVSLAKCFFFFGSFVLAVFAADRWNEPRFDTYNFGRHSMSVVPHSFISHRNWRWWEHWIRNGNWIIKIRNLFSQIFVFRLLFLHRVELRSSAPFGSFFVHLLWRNSEP